jgi:GNAT superfamily N-acetyltransferase
VWEGHDYIPLVFERWLKDKNCHFYGVDADGRVVAVGNLHLIENKRTGWMEGLRVHPDFRGKGYANELTRFFVGKGEDLGVERLRYTTGENNFVSLKLAANAGFTRVLDKAVYWCAKPKKMLKSQGYSPIEEEKLEKVYQLLKTNRDLIPRNVLIYDWKAVDATAENLLEIGHTRGFFVAFKADKLDSLSLGHSKEDLESTWGFTVHASDSAGFLAHLSFHVNRAIESHSSQIMITFEKEFEKILTQTDFGCEEQDNIHLVLVERQIKRTS